jgi:hypothetical protein
MLNNDSKYEKILRQNLSFSWPIPPSLLLDDSAGRIAKELWWTNREFSSVDIIPPWFSILISSAG